MLSPEERARGGAWDRRRVPRLAPATHSATCCCASAAGRRCSGVAVEGGTIKVGAFLAGLVQSQAGPGPVRPAG